MLKAFVLALMAVVVVAYVAYVVGWASAAVAHGFAVVLR